MFFFQSAFFGKKGRRERLKLALYLRLKKRKNVKIRSGRFNGKLTKKVSTHQKVSCWDERVRLFWNLRLFFLKTQYSSDITSKIRSFKKVTMKKCPLIGGYMLRKPNLEPNMKILNKYRKCTQRRSGASQHMTKTSIILKIALRCLFNRMRIYSTVQLCSITSLWHSGQHLCRAIGRLQVRISLGFWLFSKRRSL